jgi:hypothetical protein
MRKKPGPKSKETKPPFNHLSPDRAIFKIVEEASVELEAALEAFQEEDEESLAFLMERVARASGLLKGTVLILKENGEKV